MVLFFYNKLKTGGVKQMNKPKINTKQKKFIDNIVYENDSNTTAYKKAYNNNNTNSSAVNACNLLRKPNVKDYYKQKLEELEEKQILSLEQRNKILSSIALEQDTKKADKIKAIDVLNKADKVYTDNVIDSNITVTLDSKLQDWSK